MLHCKSDRLLFDRRSRKCTLCEGHLRVTSTPQLLLKKAARIAQTSFAEYYYCNNGREHLGVRLTVPARASQDPLNAPPSLNILSKPRLLRYRYPLKCNFPPCLNNSQLMQSRRSHRSKARTTKKKKEECDQGTPPMDWTLDATS